MPTTVKARRRGVTPAGVIRLPGATSVTCRPCARQLPRQLLAQHDKTQRRLP